MIPPFCASRLRTFPALPSSARETREWLEAFSIFGCQRLQMHGDAFGRQGLPRPGEQASTECGKPGPIDQCEIYLPCLLHDVVMKTSYGFVDHREKQPLVNDVV